MFLTWVLATQTHSFCENSLSCAFVELCSFMLDHTSFTKKKKKKSACGQQEILRSRTESHNDYASFCVTFFKLKPSLRAVEEQHTPPSFLVSVEAIQLSQEKTPLPYRTGRNSHWGLVLHHCQYKFCTRTSDGGQGSAAARKYSCCREKVFKNM